MKLTDLKELRVNKKSLSPEPEKAPVQNQPRKRSVELRSKEEEHARNEGLFKGQKVRMMDTNDTATIVGFGKDFYELELYGLTIRAVRSEFIPINERPAFHRPSPSLKFPTKNLDEASSSFLLYPTKSLVMGFWLPFSQDANSNQYF